MRDLGTPVLDNHLHLDAENRGIEAVKDFSRAGGTHLLVVNKPSWHVLGELPEELEDFRPVFEETLGLVHAATEELRGRAWPVLGVHPALVSRLVDDAGYDPAEARALMQAGLEVAAEYADGDAVALKTGRPHYDVSEEVWAASNAVLRRGLELGAETGVAVQLHTETTEDLTDVASWAEAAGLPPERVVKHYSSGELAGVTKSVMSRKEYLETAVSVGEPFLMETDFIDDADRPGAVMGPKTVPRRVDWLLEEGYENAVRVAHVDTPELVYGIDTTETMD